MFRVIHPPYVYRPVLLEQPSMWRFVVLSVLIHVWLVVLFGDASGGRQDSAIWGRSFFATIEQAAKGVSITSGGAQSRSSSQATSRLRPGQQTREVSAGSVEAAAPDVSASVPAVTTPAVEPVKELDIEKIPAIAVEVAGAVTPFAVAPIVVERLVPPVSSVEPVYSPIPPVQQTRPGSTPKVNASDAEFAIYVPPIVERAAIVTTPAPMLATPPLLPLPTSVKQNTEREFAPYVAPPVVPPATAPSVTLEAAAPVVPSVVAPAAPAIQIAPVKAVDAIPIAAETIIAQPIAPLTLSPASKALESYRPPAIDVPNAVPSTTSSASANSAASVARESAGAAAQPQSATASGNAATSTNAPPTSAGAGPAALLNLPVPLPPTALPASPSPPSPSTTAPRLDLDQLRRQAREVGREGSGSRSVLPFPMVAKETPKKDMEKIFDKALKRPDCKDAYADLGLLAVVPLLRDAAKDGGCKW